MSLYKDFLLLARANFSESPFSDISAALHIAVRRLRGQKRYNGDPFVFHSIRMAMIVIEELGLGRNSVLSTLLHDVSRTGLISDEEVVEKFGREPLVILHGLNNISQVDPKTSSLQVDNFKELIVSYSTDPRVILLKIADRLEVMRSLDMFPELKRNKKSWETIHLYAQLSHKLGLYNVKSEMEDLALRQLEPKDYDAVERKLAESKDEREKFITEFSAPIVERLDRLGIKYKLKSRTKSVYSIWRKMKRQKVAFEDVYDIFALRIIIDCPQEYEKMQCWTVFSVVTDFYTPNPDRMRDWISIPRSNGYESLHTTVVGRSGQWVEVQIRSEHMDAVAERGVAAHWRYKGVGGGPVSTEVWLDRLRNIVESSAPVDSLSEGFNIAMSTNEVFVFTPNGDLRKLPEGATVLDFAFDIHTSLGARCTGARVNGRNVPIREKLKSGDVVEILSSKTQKAKAAWLAFVVTSKARNKIKQLLREEQAASATLVREELERKLKNWKLNISIEEAVNQLVKHYKVKTGMEIYSMIAAQKITMADVKDFLTRYIEGTLPAAQTRPRKENSGKDAREDEALVIDETLRQVEYRLAKCCNPIFGDDIFGFVTINTGITIHRSDCPNAARLKEQYPYRILGARWKSSAGSGVFRATISVRGEDVEGLAMKVTDAISRDMKINIRSMSFNRGQGVMEGTLSIEVSSSQAVDMVLHNVKKIKGITRVYRIN